MMLHPNLERGQEMKHWIAVGIIAVLATGLSLADGAGGRDADTTPGLPQGWVAEGFVPGLDQIAVERPRDGSAPRLAILKHAGADSSSPLLVYQTIDATPWRGRTLVFSSYLRVDLDPEVMRRTGGAQAVELHVDCGGGARGATVALNAGRLTRHWLEHNIPLAVPADATRCSFGVASRVKAEIRLSRVHLKDRAREREALLARRWPEWQPPSGADSMFPPGLATDTQTAPPNLEFKQ
jgi:hypothetical protein